MESILKRITKHQKRITKHKLILNRMVTSKTIEKMRKYVHGITNKKKINHLTP